MNILGGSLNPIAYKYGHFTKHTLILNIIKIAGESKHCKLCCTDCTDANWQFHRTVCKQFAWKHIVRVHALSASFILQSGLETSGFYFESVLVLTLHYRKCGNIKLRQREEEWVVGGREIAMAYINVIHVASTFECH